MFRTSACCVLVVAAAACGAGSARGEDLLANGGFESGLAGWEVKVAGEWAGRADRSRIVAVTAGGRTGEKALTVDTTALNPGGKITDELRTWRRPKWEIHVVRRVKGVQPNAWYLARWRIRSQGVAIQTGLELLLDIEPWPLRTYGKSLAESHWKQIHAWERRLFLPQAVRTDGRFHEHVLLKQTYAQTDTLAVGLRIRAPWTGRIAVDDVELVRIDPEKDLTPMRKLLAMRGARPIEEVRPLHRQTLLVDAGRPAGAILVGREKAHRALAEKIRATVASLTGAKLPIAERPADIPAGRAIVAIGSVNDNDLVARLHFNRYVRADAASPGAGGYVLWTVAEPYGLARGQNVIVVAGGDAAGQRAGVEAFCKLLAAKGQSIRLPYLHRVFPKRTIPPAERDVPRSQWGTHWDRNRWAGFSKWYLSRWLATGELAVAELARRELLLVADEYLKNPYFQTAWDTYEVGWAWDAIEEAPVFSDADRLKITNVLAAYLHMRPQQTSDWSRMVPDLATGPTWNHQAKGLSGAYTAGRYFQRYYGDHDARYAYYLSAARNAFSAQRPWSKPQENSGNYWLITMRFAMSYYLGEWDRALFDGGALLRYATYFPVVCNNKGWIAGFGDTYYCYHGAAARCISGTGIGDPSLALWRYRDGRIAWWLERCGFDGYERLYHPGLKPVEWKELLGVHVVPLERGLYDAGTKLPLWGSGGEGTDGPVGEVRFEQTFDKISFRSDWRADGEYMLLEGNGRGIHSGRATNQICKLSLLGEDLLIGSGYSGNNIRSNDSVIVIRDARLDDPAVKGKSEYPFAWWQPLWAKYPSYAALEAMADLPSAGLVRTALRGYQGCDWHRNVFWVKGAYFAVIDEVTARRAGVYYVESNLKTCPVARKSYPRLTPRTWKLLPDRRGLSQALRTKGEPTDLLLLTDGTSPIRTEKVSHQYIDALMVRQVREGQKLSAGQKVTFINLFCGRRGRAGPAWRIERLGATDALIFRGREAVAYFGCGQGPKGRAVLPIDARMFLLTGGRLAVVDGRSAGKLLEGDRPASREIAVPPAAARQMLDRLAGRLRGR